MSAILDWYKDVVYNRGDPRTSDWFLVREPGPLMMILVCYVYFCTSAGPRYMKDKKPYDLKNVMIVYNFMQVLFSLYSIHEGYHSGWNGHYNLYCQPVDYSDDPMALRMAKIVHFYYMCKLIELLDTVFFVLRKKNKQISTLHVYHHTLMPFCAWIGIKFYPGGHGTLLGLVNSFIHVIMYTYYMLTAFGPQIQKYLWWKKYLTIMQLIQFCIIFVHNMLVLFNGCDYPKHAAFLLVLNATIFIYMFSQFYIESYTKNTRQNTAADGKTVTTASRGKSE